jgi:hypothetical protein
LDACDKHLKNYQTTTIESGDAAAKEDNAICAYIDDCEIKMEMFGMKCASLIDHVENVNQLNIELASELEKVYTDLAREKAKNIQLTSSQSQS